MLTVIICAVIILLPVVFVVAQYNALVGLRNYIRESWSNVDTELKRRYDLIPNLVAVVKGYAAHERAVLERVTELRNRCAANNGPVADQSRDEVQLVDSLKQLLVVVENYPQLKSNENFLRLQDELAGTENRIAVERRRYNETVQDYNTFIALFPNSLVASMSGFARNDAYFKTEEGARAVPKVSFGTPNAPAAAPQPAPAKP